MRDANKQNTIQTQNIHEVRAKKNWHQRYKTNTQTKKHHSICILSGIRNTKTI